MLKKIAIYMTIVSIPLILSGCVAAAVGTSAVVGGYALAKDKGSAGSYADDAVITSKIKSRYIADINLKSYNISVSTYDGIVVLTGSVPNEEMRQKATEIARMTAGVKAVNITNFVVVP